MAQILGTGIDLIEVDRIERAIKRPLTGARFRKRVFTDGEVTYCESRGRPRFQSYAGRFAAKEATMKALGTGWNRNVGWGEIEVVRQRGHAPTIELIGQGGGVRAQTRNHGVSFDIAHTVGDGDGARDAEG